MTLFLIESFVSVLDLLLARVKSLGIDYNLKEKKIIFLSSAEDCFALNIDVHTRRTPGIFRD